MFVTLTMNHAAYGCKVWGFPTAPLFALSRSNVDCLITGIHCRVWQPELHDCQNRIGHCSRERMSADGCLKWTPGCYMKLTLSIKSCCTVSITIPISLKMTRQMLLFSRWINVPTLTYKMQLASILSISCNIQHIGKQQSHRKLQWSTLWKTTFRHFQQANMANPQPSPHNNVIKRRMARVAWKPKESELLRHCAACDIKRSLQLRHNEKCTS